jgi:hypothetical protein
MYFHMYVVVLLAAVLVGEEINAYNILRLRFCFYLERMRDRKCSSFETGPTPSLAI